MSRAYKIVLASIAVLCLAVIGYYLLRQEPQLQPPDAGMDVAIAAGDSAEWLGPDPELQFNENGAQLNDLLARVNTHIELVDLTGKADLSPVGPPQSTTALAYKQEGPIDEADTPTLTLGSGPAAESALMRIVAESSAGGNATTDNKAVKMQPPLIDGRALDVPSTGPKPRTYTIQPGDTLISIAIQHFGSALRWVDIAQANPELDASRLKPGRVIELSTSLMPVSRPDPERSRRGKATRYLVRSSDTLSSISKRFYGDPGHWPVIYRANRGKIGHDPNRLDVGTWLKIESLPTASPPPES